MNLNINRSTRGPVAPCGWHVAALIPWDLLPCFEFQRADLFEDVAIGERIGPGRSSAGVAPAGVIAMGNEGGGLD